MRIVVLSDSHRAKRKLFDIVEIQMATTDLFIFLGDGEDDFDEVIERYPEIKYERVCGNCDWDSMYPMYNEITANGKKLFYTHGHPFRVKYGLSELEREAYNRQVDICLFGHTHNQFTDYREGIYYMNPGAVADGNYGMIDIVDKGIVLIPAQL